MVAPLLAGLVPRRLIPEVVLLLALDVVIGPGVLGLAAVGEGLEVLRELGLGMLFLLAGGAITVLLLPMTAALLEPQSRQRTTDCSATTTSR